MMQYLHIFKYSIHRIHIYIRIYIYTHTPMYTYLWVLFQCYVLFQQLGWRSACRRWSKVGLAVLQRSVPHHRKYGSGWGESQTHGMPTGYHEDVYMIYIYIYTSLIYVCIYIYIYMSRIGVYGYLGSSWCLKWIETIWNSFKVGSDWKSLSQFTKDERKQCENSPKQPWYSADIKSTRKKWKEFSLAKQAIPNFKLCISPGAETHSGRCKKMGVLNLGGRWRAAYVTWPPRI